jgi:predicted GIY-YIG superfamily endonuclease
VGGWVYIMASALYGTLYVGVTSDISRRVFEHREGIGSAFCRKYGVRRLVHSEPFRGYLQRHPSREAPEKMVARLEDQVD